MWIGQAIKFLSHCSVQWNLIITRTWDHENYLVLYQHGRTGPTSFWGAEVFYQNIFLARLDLEGSLSGAGGAPIFYRANKRLLYNHTYTNHKGLYLCNITCNKRFEEKKLAQKSSGFVHIFSFLPKYSQLKYPASYACVYQSKEDLKIKTWDHQN